MAEDPKDARFLLREHEDAEQHAAASRENDSFWRLTLERIPGLVFTATADGACAYVSEQWIEFTGVPATELLGDGWTQVLHPEDRSRAWSAWRQTVEGRGQYDLEYRVRSKHGAYEWFKVRGHAIRDAMGTVVRWFGIAVDVDDLKRAEAALVVRERELRTLTDNTPDVLCRLDRELRFVFANPAVEAATGLRPEQVLGKTNRELGMPPELCELWNSSARAVFEQRPAGSVEFAFEGPSGVRCFASRLIPELGPSDEVEHVLVVTHDVTDIEQAHKALADADRRKDEFLTTLAHELRNPLAPLRNGLELLRRVGQLTETTSRAHAMMERQLSHLVRLVDDLLDVARVSRGLLEIKPQRTSLQVVIAHAVEACQPQLEAAGHAFVVRAPDSPLWVDGDLTRLVQVIANLLDNAAKYTPNGGHIELWAAEDGGEAIVRVTDDGIGIDADMLPRVFDRFAQASQGPNRTRGGLGIGLSLVHEIVRMHGGAITAQSAGLGRGSTFTLRLPLADTDGDPASDRSPSPEPSAPSRRRVLIVDDNVDGAETLAMLLTLSGHEAATASDGPAALEIARTWRPELVFLDIGMPEMDGYEVARRLRAEPATADVVLVALTGWGSDDAKLESEAAGFDLHLIKPAGPEVVADVLARLPALRRAKASE